MCVYICVYVCVFICVRMCMDMCVYVYIYILPYHVILSCIWFFRGLSPHRGLNKKLCNIEMGKLMLHLSRSLID